MVRLLLQSLSYGWHMLCSRRLYFAAMAGVPIVFAIFFLSLQSEGLPLKVPAAVVDLDHSQLSRRVTRNLAATELIDVTDCSESYHDAMQKVQSGEVMGFFYIPSDFERDAINGNGATITFYSNLTFFVPGTLMFKGFKTVAVTSSAGVAVSKLTMTGLVDSGEAVQLMQPVVIDTNLIGNPWTNYAIYLGCSFIPGVLALMIALVTCFSIGDEIKKHTSPQWLARSGGSIVVAVFGKLAPQWVVWASVGVFLQALMFGFLHFPLNCHPMHMILAMLLLVTASQGLGLLFCCALPNLRLALILASLTGILAFSVAAYSYPVQSMYGAMGIFSYILPVRYYFLIYSDQALGGMPLYYSRWFYVALLAFIILPMPMLGRLKRRAFNPIYVP